MNLVFEKISQTLAAGAKLDIGIAGSFLRLSECQWPVTISLLKEGRVIGTMNNMLAGDYVQGVDFDAVWVVNGAAAQVVGLQISGGGAGSNRVIGEVSIVNGEKSRVLSNQAYSVKLQTVSVAGQLAHCQLFNPGGSGKNLIVDGLLLSVVNQQSISIGEYSTALANANAAAVASKLLGGAVAPVALPKYGNNAAMLLTTYLAMVTVPNASSVDIDPLMNSPIVVPPGRGLTVVSHTANYDFSCNVSFFEESI